MPVILDARVLAGSGGGPDKTIINSPQYLEADGYRMLCGYMHHPEDPGFDLLRRKAIVKNVELISIPDYGPLDWRVVPRMLAICREHQVDVWHAHDYKTNALGLLLKRFWPMRLVTTLHGWVHHTARTPVYYLVDRLSLRFYEKVICVSEDLYQASRKAGVPASRCLLLENGIDLNDYQRRQTVAEGKAALGFSPERWLVGAAGRLSSEKGFDLLIHAIHQLCAVGVNVELAIAGEGDQRGYLEQLIQQLGMVDRVRLLGYQTSLHGFYEAMDVYAMSSYREGLPNVLLEAMALEVPVVATAVNGIPRLIQDGVNGLLVPPGSSESLAGRLKLLLEDARLRTKLASGGRKTVENRYCFATRMKKLSDLYASMGIR